MKQLFMVALLLFAPLAYAGEHESKKDTLSASTTEKSRGEWQNLKEFSDSFDLACTALKRDPSSNHQRYLANSLERCKLNIESILTALWLCEENDLPCMLAKPEFNTFADNFLESMMILRDGKRKLDAQLIEKRIAEIVKTTQENNERLAKHIEYLEKARDAERTEKLKLQTALETLATKFSSAPASASMPSASLTEETAAPAFDCSALANISLR